MTLPTDLKSRDESTISELQRVFQTMERLVYDGLHHGYFQYSIKGSVGKNLRRELVIEAGVSHKFTVPIDEISRQLKTTAAAIFVKQTLTHSPQDSKVTGINPEHASTRWNGSSHIMDASKNTGPRAVVAGPSFSDNSHSKTSVLLSRLIQLNDQVSGSDRNATTH